MPNDAAAMNIGELAARYGVTTKTIRYYEQLGLLRPAARTTAGYRRYGEDEAQRLEFIAKAKRLGLSLDEIGQILALSGKGSDPCPHVLALFDRHLGEIDEALRRLGEFRDRLAELRVEAERASRGRVCGIIEHSRTDWLPLPFDRPLARPTRR